MTTAKRIIVFAAMAAVVVLAFSGCFLLPNYKIEVEGTWIDAFNGKRVITNTEMQVYTVSTNAEPDYVFEIVEFENSGFNGGETGTDDSGYAVCKCTTPPSYNTAQLGTYTVFRWQKLVSTGESMTAEIGEGSPATWPDGYLSTAADAVTNVTVANGWFAFGYTAATLQQ
jgi:hypothetical protein